MLIEESHHCHTMRGEVAGPVGVVKSCSIGVMRPAIDLDAQLQFGTVEVENVAVDRMLSLNLWPPRYRWRNQCQIFRSVAVEHLRNSRARSVS